MFTGIVKEIGRVEQAERTDAGARLRIAAGFAGELALGDSVAVSGVCLTAAAIDGDSFEADVMNQTLELTTLGSLSSGDTVNLEPPLRAGEPLGGHLVQGHVDSVASVHSVTEDGFARRVRVILAREHQPLVVEHGSVTLDGTSLTVANLTEDGFEVSLIPETLERTTLGGLEAGSDLNLELDVIARYVERLLGFNQKGGN
ncbi:MAG: riboflavin synthase [Actinomycetota bacterium]|nr:riboflavin synthase [Actinomycetota bacterium]